MGRTRPDTHESWYYKEQGHQPHVHHRLYHIFRRCAPNASHGVESSYERVSETAVEAPGCFASFTCFRLSFRRRRARVFKAVEPSEFPLVSKSILATAVSNPSYCRCRTCEDKQTMTGVRVLSVCCLALPTNMSSAPRICVQHLKALRLCSTSYRIVIRSTAPCPFLLVNSVLLVKKAKTYDNSDMLTFRWRGVRKSSPVLQGSLGVPTNYSLHPCVHLTRKIGSTSRVMPARDLRSHCYDHLL